jgi:NAD(P)-dependent dehydrogenase (short-subunit alcohol dehydrogenase family)
MPTPGSHPSTTFLITGANRGIGLELTRQAVAREDHVIATCRRPDDAGALRELRGRHPESIEVHELDVASDGSVATLVATLGDRAIDVLINNAGIYGGDAQTLTDTDYAAWSETLAVNTLAPFRVTAALLPALRRSHRPRVLTVSSEMGSLAGKSTGAYAYRSSKAAVNKVMQVLAEELRNEGIAVILAHPGWVSTDMGGCSAPVSPQESAGGLLALVDRMTLEDSGRFLAWTGEELPW